MNAESRNPYVVMTVKCAGAGCSYIRGQACAQKLFERYLTKGGSASSEQK
jgi:hypothetical protein